TANDGTEALVIPNTPTTTARIKVEAVGNIFFDICNTNFTITSGSSCGTPSGLSSSAITTSGATVSWTAVSGAASYDVDYKLTSTSTWTNAATATASTSVTIGGLSVSTVYDWRVRTNCASASSAYATGQFTTASVPVCNAPTGLSSTGITTSGATVSWSAVSGAVSYDVDYKLTSSGTWTNAATATTSTSVAIGGLSASTVYDWRVRTNCSFGSSGYSASQFTTSAVFVCNAPSGLAAGSITTSSATVSWTAVSGAVSYDVDYKLTSTSTWTNASTATASTSTGLSGLSASTVYDWRVRTNCSSDASGYSAAQFTTATASTCATAFEPNETTAAAASITSGVINSAAINSATDIDYFKITTTSTSTMVYNLAGPSGVDYDLYIYNSAGTQVGSGTGSTATETTSLSNQAAGTYFVKVIGYNGANSATCYTIKATSTTVTGCQSTYDVSTNGTTAGAATIPFNTNITGLISPSGDIDIYKFVITTAGTITVTLGTLPGDYDLKLLNSAGTQVGISQNGSTTSETINYTAATGTYYAQVYGYNGANSASVCYTLKTQLGTATKNGSDDLIVRIYPNPVTNVLSISVLGSTSKDNILQVVDSKGTVVMEQQMVNNPQMLDVSKLTKGVYMIRSNNGGSPIVSKFIKQ
ncbi:MAG: fibronectin type III domain-containing protein, partial [Ferruginibacter sp.]